MFEILFLLFLFAGLFKDILLSTHTELPVDITLLSGITLFTYAIFKAIHREGGVFKFINTSCNKRLIPIGLFLIFCLWCLLTIMIGLDGEYPSKKFIHLLTHFIPLTAIFFHKNIHIKRFAYGFIIVAIGFSFFYFFTSPSIKYYEDPKLHYLDYEYITGLGLTSSMLIAPAILLSLFYIRNIIVKLSLAYLLFFMLFYVSARGSLLALIIVLIVLVYLKRKSLLPYFNEKIKPRITKIVSSILVITVILTTLISLDEYKKNTFKLSLYKNKLLLKSADDSESWSISNYLKERGENHRPEGKNKSILTRVWHYKFIGYELKENPKLLIHGVGFGSYSMSCCGSDILDHPHNLILELTYETGLIGLIIFLIFIFYVIRRGLTNQLLLCFFLCLLFYLLHSMKSSSIIDLRLMFGFIALILYTNVTCLKKYRL